MVKKSEILPGVCKLRKTTVDIDFELLLETAVMNSI